MVRRGRPSTALAETLKLSTHQVPRHVLKHHLPCNDETSAVPSALHDGLVCYHAATAFIRPYSAELFHRVQWRSVHWRRCCGVRCWLDRGLSVSSTSTTSPEANAPSDRSELMTKNFVDPQDLGGRGNSCLRFSILLLILSSEKGRPRMLCDS